MHFKGRQRDLPRLDRIYDAASLPVKVRRGVPPSRPVFPRLILHRKFGAFSRF